jgi:hypothetical protein
MRQTVELGDLAVDVRGKAVGMGLVQQVVEG